MKKWDVGKGGWKNIPIACSLGQEGFWGSPGQCPAPGVCGYARAEYPQWPGAAHPVPVTSTQFHPELQPALTSPVTWCCPPHPCHGHSLPSQTPACPDICSCTDPKERSGTERASKTNQFPDGSSPWWSAFCCQPLDLQIRAETRGGGCSLLPFPSAAATPQHSHWEAGWQLVLHCLLQWLSTTLESHSQQLPLVSSDMAAGHGESGLLSERLKDSSLHMDCLEDAIPAHGSAGGCHPSMQSSLHFNLQ